MDIPPRLRIGILAAAIAVAAAGLFGLRHAAAPAGTSASQDAPVRDSAAPIAAVVDVQHVLDGSEAQKKMLKQLEAMRAKFQDDAQKEENFLQQADRNLNASRDHLSPAVYNEREQQLQKRGVTASRSVDARRRYLEQSEMEASNIVRDKFLQIVRDITQKKGAVLAIVKQQTLWTDPSLDITDEVLVRLNKELPKVTIKPFEEDKDESKE